VLLLNEENLSVGRITTFRNRIVKENNVHFYFCKVVKDGKI
jgi:hypothetical protein